MLITGIHIRSQVFKSAPRMLSHSSRLIFLVAVSLCRASTFELDRAASLRIQAGKEQLERLELDPNSQGCWAKAVDDLKEGCRSMDDVQRSRLAVQVAALPHTVQTPLPLPSMTAADALLPAVAQFTNCHLEKSAMTTYACTSAMSVAECTRPMVDSPSGLAYSAYTTFYTHAESMCAPNRPHPSSRPFDSLDYSARLKKPAPNKYTQDSRIAPLISDQVLLPPI